ncbi:MAG: prefoldin subunit alpha [Candidatus Altiarchaeota archaeon]|nr:prefoldin subunit alpha [Candidatus Altiarchaeota archaeon]
MNPRSNDEQELQKTLMQLESERRRMEALSKQGQAVEAAMMEVNATIQAIESLKDVKEGTEMLVPMGANTFVKATLKDRENILVGIGAGASVEKTRADAVKSLESRREQLNKSMGALHKMSAELAGRIEGLNDVAETMINKSKQQ